MRGNLTFFACRGRFFGRCGLRKMRTTRRQKSAGLRISNTKLFDELREGAVSYRNVIPARGIGGPWFWSSPDGRQIKEKDMRRNVWYWGKKAGKWFWKLRVGSKLSSVAECGEKIAARLNRMASKRLAAAQVRLRRLPAGDGCGQAPSLRAAGREPLRVRCSHDRRSGDRVFRLCRYDDVQHRRLPANESDTLVSGTDSISGTFVTDGALGLLSSQDIVGGTLTFTDVHGDVFTAAATFSAPVRWLQPAHSCVSNRKPGRASQLAPNTQEVHLDGVGAHMWNYANDPNGTQYYYGGVSGEVGMVATAYAYFDSTPIPTMPG